MRKEWIMLIVVAVIFYVIGEKKPGLLAMIGI